MNRKTFIKRFTITASTFLPMGLFIKNGEDKNAGVRLNNACGTTDAATAGPFYIHNAQKTTQINYQNLPGIPMLISGQVFGDVDQNKPLPGVRVEIWHADGEGNYHPNGNGDVKSYAPNDINLRGVGFTDAKGRFSFSSIVPGNYGSRRKHIHWKFFIDGYKNLTTQTYWLSEKGSAKARRDYVDRDTESCRWIEFNENKGVHEGFFEVVLEKA